MIASEALVRIDPGFPPGVRAPHADDRSRWMSALATANSTATRFATAALLRVLGPRTIAAIEVDGTRPEPFVEAFPTAWWDHIGIAGRVLRITEMQSVSEHDDGRLRVVRGGRFEPVDPSSYLVPTGSSRGDPALRPDTARIAALIADGAVLNLNYLEDHDVPIRRITELMGRLCLCPVNVNVYVSRDGPSGTGPHWDSHDVVVLQVSGSKSWRVAEPTDQAPIKGGTLNVSAGRLVMDEVLHAGEAMFIPRGFWHEATSTKDLSIHLTISISRPTTRHLLDYLARASAVDPLLRADLRTDDIERVEHLLQTRGPDDEADTPSTVLSEFWAAVGVTQRPLTSSRLDLVSNLLAMESWAGLGLHARVPTPGRIAVIGKSDDNVQIALGAHTITGSDAVVRVIAQLCAGDACPLDGLERFPAAAGIDTTALVRQLLLSGLVDVYLGDEPDWPLVTGEAGR